MLYFADQLSEPEDQNEGKCPAPKTKPLRYRIYEDSFLDDLLRGLKCKICSKPDLCVNYSNDRGFQFKITIVCSSCNEINNECYSSPQVNDINLRMTNAFLDMGAGYAGMQKLGTEMNMNILCRKTFTNYVNIVHENSKELQEKTREATLRAVRKAYVDADPCLADQEILDVIVTYDGSYHTRGHASNEGIGMVIDAFTGLVLDDVVISKFCSWCSLTEKKFENNKPELEKAMQIHAASGNCEKNFSGSSNMMEVEAAVILWKRSIELNKMRYIVMLSDGDCKSFEYLVKINVYPGYQIKKQECINHVGKRLYRAIKKIIGDWAEKDVILNGSKAGSLTEEKVKKLQGYYSGAIRKNAPDVAAMKLAIFATIYHCSSTNEDPQHDLCPVGDKSWCFWQRAVAEGREPDDHSIMKTFVRPEVARKLLPAYETLTRTDLLEKCTQKGTQNANECIHNSIWLKCPKNKGTTKKKVEVRKTYF